MEVEDWDFTAIYFDCIDHLCHGFMPYYPPRMPNVSEEDYEIYKDVIVGAYKFHDMMLERQLQMPEHKLRTPVRRRRMQALKARPDRIQPEVDKELLIQALPQGKARAQPRGCGLDFQLGGSVALLPF